MKRRNRMAWKAEREMWMRDPHRTKWWPWWLHSHTRHKIFVWFGIALVAGVFVGRGTLHWWQVALAIGGLWFASGAIAWVLTRPLIMVVKAARDIGDGKLDTRVEASRHHGEMRLLATAINEMASRIETQIKDQRQLLAAVSHELRTPLGHMRVLIDTAREGRNGSTLDELEREVIVLDDLVGKLLAQSRLEFGNLDKRTLELGPLVTDIATAAGVPFEVIEASGDTFAAIDPTLVRRAIANLLDNAKNHGKGVIAIRIERRPNQVAIEVDDAGPGFPPDKRAFRAFVPSSNGGLGLGLALVSRIAVAHGGGAWILDRPGGGARVGFSVAV